MDKELSKQTLEQMLQDAEQASALATAAAEEASRSAKQIREMAEQYLADPTLDEAMAAQLQQLCDASNMQAVEAAQVALEAQARAGQVAAALAEHTQLSAATAQEDISRRQQEADELAAELAAAKAAAAAAAEALEAARLKAQQHLAASQSSAAAYQKSEEQLSSAKAKADNASKLAAAAQTSAAAAKDREEEAKNRLAAEQAAIAAAAEEVTRKRNEAIAKAEAEAAAKAEAERLAAEAAAQAEAERLAAEKLVAEQRKKAHKKEKRGIGHTIWTYVKLIVLAALLAVVLRTFVFELTVVDGVSMQPTLESGNNVITSKIAYQLDEPKRGDVIVIDAPDLTDTNYVKRIIALPNEHLVIDGGNVYIDGELLDEPYLAPGTITEGSIDMVLPEGYYFLMGDNREESRDSRYSSVGAIAFGDIQGKVIVIVYPFDDLGLVK